MKTTDRNYLRTNNGSKLSPLCEVLSPAHVVLSMDQQALDSELARYIEQPRIVDFSYRYWISRIEIEIHKSNEQNK